MHEHYCSCKAGQGICNHKVTLMYQTAHYCLLKFHAVPDTPSKTSMPQEWLKPQSAGIHPEAVDNVIIRKPELRPEGDRKCKRCAIDGVESNLYNPTKSIPMENFQANAKTDLKETHLTE